MWRKELSGKVFGYPAYLRAADHGLRAKFIQSVSLIMSIITIVWMTITVIRVSVVIRVTSILGVSSVPRHRRSAHR